MGLGMFWWSNRLRLWNLSLIYDIMKICEEKLGTLSIENLPTATTLSQFSVVAHCLRVKHVSLKLSSVLHTCVWYNITCYDLVELETGVNIQNKWNCSTDGLWKHTWDSVHSIFVCPQWSHTTILWHISVEQMWVGGVRESLIRFMLKMVFGPRKLQLASWAVILEIFQFSWDRVVFDAEESIQMLLTADDTTELDQGSSLLFNQWWQGPGTEKKLWRHTIWGTNEIVEDKSCINVLL